MVRFLKLDALLVMMLSVSVAVKVTVWVLGVNVPSLIKLPGIVMLPPGA